MKAYEFKELIDQIVDYTIHHDAGYAYVILRKGEKLAYTRVRQEFGNIMEGL